MAGIDRRKKNANWSVAEPDGTVPDWIRAQLAVLMDLRDELQAIRRLLECTKGQDIPRVLRQIRAHTSRIPKQGER
jgi:hypothetical protein